MAFSFIIALVFITVAWQQESWLVLGQVYFKRGAPHAQLSNGGLVSGTVQFSRDGRPYNAFTGIPYATVPERFQESQLITVPSWQGVLNATKPGLVYCPQVLYGQVGESVGEEDCLSLNVYVPIGNNGSGKRGYPVLVWIHGGGFTYGAGSEYSPKYIIDENVIMVTINYRLGVFGFLSTGDNVVPGNNGLKDMVVALKWVQENIKSFGGDPSMVTIFGESAGGVATHYLLLSPTAKGLFHRAISQSGSSLMQVTYNPDPKLVAVELATHLGCQTSASKSSGITSEEILTCLKGLTTEVLNKAQSSFKTSWPANMRSFFFTPTVEPTEFVSSLTPFLSEPPISILTRKDNTLAEIPWMVGVTEDEGACLFAGLILENPELLEELNSNWGTIASSLIDYLKYLPAEEQAQVSQKLKQFYFGDNAISEETRVPLRNMFSDQLVLHGVYRAALETASRGNPVYLYEYAYQGPYSALAEIYNLKGEEAKMVGHSDELIHQFDFSWTYPPDMEDPMKPDSTDEEFSKNFIRLWTSFAIHGEPKHSWGNATLKEWKPLCKKQLDEGPLRWFRIQENPVFYDIDQSVKDRMQFWDDLWNQHFTPVLMAYYRHASQDLEGKVEL